MQRSTEEGKWYTAGGDNGQAQETITTWAAPRASSVASSYVCTQTLRSCHLTFLKCAFPKFTPIKNRFHKHTRLGETSRQGTWVPASRCLLRTPGCPSALVSVTQGGSPGFLPQLVLRPHFVPPVPSPQLAGQKSCLPKTGVSWATGMHAPRGPAAEAPHGGEPSPSPLGGRPRCAEGSSSTSVSALLLLGLPQHLETHGHIPDDKKTTWISRQLEVSGRRA